MTDGLIVHDLAALQNDFFKGVDNRWKEQRIAWLFPDWETQSTEQFTEILNTNRFTPGEYAAIIVTVGRKGKFLDILPDLIRTWDKEEKEFACGLTRDVEVRYISLQSMYVICGEHNNTPAIRDFLPKMEVLYFSALKKYEILAEKARKEGVFIRQRDLDRYKNDGLIEIIERVLREREYH